MATNKSVYVDFTSEPPLGIFNSATGITALAATTTVNGFRTSQGQYFEMYNDGQNDECVLTGGKITTNGWVPPVDNAADGLEITRGINSASNAKSVFTVGTDAAFFIRVGGKIGTIARTTVLTVGFRKLGAYVAIKAADATTALAAYTDKAMVGVVAVAGTVATQTSNDNSDVQTSLAATALVDSRFFSFEVDVSAAGVVTYKVGQSTTLALAEAALAADASAVAFSFDDAEVLVPSIMLVGTAATGINDSAIHKIEIGYQS